MGRNPLAHRRTPGYTAVPTPNDIKWQEQIREWENKFEKEDDAFFYTEEYGWVLFVEADRLKFPYLTVRPISLEYLFTCKSYHATELIHEKNIIAKIKIKQP